MATARAANEPSDSSEEDRVRVRAARTVDPLGGDRVFWLMAVSDGSRFVVLTAYMTGADHRRIEGDPEETVVAWMERRVRSLPPERRLRTLELHSPLQMRP